tara:strand:+ start:3388 stop:3624 length:237 start_codon:yes stop_codon:yes gene_type:complete
MKKQILGDKYEKTAHPTVGNKYHLAWADHRCVWVLEQICPDGVYCYLKTPKTKKIFKAKVEDLRLLSKESPRNTYKPV